jgi:hypothetical protein
MAILSGYQRGRLTPPTKSTLHRHWPRATSLPPTLPNRPIDANCTCTRSVSTSKFFGYTNDVPTLAFQLAHKYPDFETLLISLLQSNPDIVDDSLHSQMERLIVEPLQSAEVSTVIVTDALDECKDEEPSSAIFSVLERLVGRIPRVKFFITGRPESQVKTGFRFPLVDLTDVFILHDVHPSSTNNDIGCSQSANFRNSRNGFN